MSQSQKDQLKAAFNAADTSNDGSLSIQEVAKVMRAHGSVDTDQQLAQAFCTDDLNNDNKLTFEEFWQSFNKRDPKTVRKEEMRTEFNKYDTDRSGSISVGELKKMFGKLSDDHVQKMISDLDSDGNAQVNFEEFLNMWQ